MNTWKNSKFDVVDYKEYEVRSREIKEYFESLMVIEKLTNGEQFKIHEINKNPLLFQIIFQKCDNYLIVNNYKEKKGFYYPQWEIIFLFELSWESRYEILPHESRWTNSEFTECCRVHYNEKLIGFNIQQIDTRANINKMTDTIRIKGTTQIDIEKIMELKKYL